MYTEKDHEEHAIQTFISIGYTHIKGSHFNRFTTSQVIDTGILREALCNINKNIPHSAIREAIETLQNLESHPKSNVDFIYWLRNGMPTTYVDDSGETHNDFINIVDFDNIENNIFYIVDQLTITGFDNETRRPDLIVYINGLPIIIFELKSPSRIQADLHVDAFNQLDEYKRVIPQLFIYNVILAIDDGLHTRIGSSTSDFSRFVPWSSIDGQTSSRSILDTVIQGVCNKNHIIEILRDFVFYVYDRKRPIKILASWHQFFAVKNALIRTEHAISGDKRIGVVWHTQGSGKSYTMVMYSSMLARDHKNPTIVVLTDRNDLDDQLYSTFSKAHDYLRNEPVQASSVAHLKELLNRQSGGIIFSTLQKFRGDDDNKLIECLSSREDIIVIVDEAHRSHYGVDIATAANKENQTIEQGYSFSKQVRTALPNASFIGFTGTPVEDKDKSTREVFGDNIHIYGLAQSVEDGMTTKITYYNRMARLKLNEPALAQIDAIYQQALDSGTPIENITKSQKEFSKLEILYEHSDRIAIIGKDIINHFETRPDERLKGMIVVSSRKSAVIIYDAIIKERPNWVDNVAVLMTTIDTDTESLLRFKTSKEERSKLAENFKDENNPFNLAIVVDMWLTGFDVCCLGVMYIDKELEKHNLMQTIARVNRVYPDKDCGLIYDYRGIFAKLQEALKMYSGEDELNKNSKAKDNILDYEEVANNLITLLEQANDFFFGIIDINDLFDKDKQSECFYKALDYLEGLYLQDDERIIYFRRLASNINSAYKICYQTISEKNQVLSSSIVALNSSLSKTVNSGEYSTANLNKKIKNLVANTVMIQTVEDVLSMIDCPNGIDILNPDILSKITGIPHKNISIKAITNILNDKINVTKKSNFAMSVEYSDRLREILQKYENKSINSGEVIIELLDLAKEFASENDKAKNLGLSEEEYAFYYAIVNKSIEEVLTTDILCSIAQGLVSIVRESKTLDWSKKESVRAKMRIAIKKLLKTYRYPPEGQDDATDKIIAQAENQEVQIK